MRLIARKPCNFGGRKFYIGEEIPLEFVADPKLQEILGVLTISNEADEEAGTAQGKKPCAVYALEDIREAYATMQLNAEKAVSAVLVMTNRKALELIVVMDSRKKVVEAANKRMGISSSVMGKNDAENDNGSTEGDKVGGI